MEIKNVCKELREVSDKLRDLASKIERDGILSLCLDGIKIYGYSVDEIKKLIYFAQEQGFDPRK